MAMMNECSSRNSLASQCSNPGIGCRARQRHSKLEEVHELPRGKGRDRSLERIRFSELKIYMHVCVPTRRRPNRAV